MADQYEDGFALLKARIKTSFWKPVRQVTFWVSLVIGTIGVGAMGFWFELWRYCFSVGSTALGVNTALQTYFPALAWAAVAQLIFVDEKAERPMQAVALGLLVVLLVLSQVGLTGGQTIPMWIAIVLGIIASVASIGMWWVTIGGSFSDKINPESPLGGPPSQDLTGSTGGYTL
jgi:hypothetical protein